MKREYPDVPLVGVGAIILDDARVVVIRRGTPPLLNEWSIPGGVLELGETLREAAAREALEETGLVVEVGEVLGVFDRIVRAEDGRTRFHYVLIDFLCRRISGELKAGHDAADARWLTREELERFPIDEKARDVLVLALVSAIKMKKGKSRTTRSSQRAGRR